MLYINTSLSMSHFQVLDMKNKLLLFILDNK